MGNRRLKLLFVCGKAMEKSASAERVYADHQAYDARAAGVSEMARRVVTADDIRWADVVLPFDKECEQFLRTHFPAAMASAVVRCLHIEDDYEFMDETLVARMTQGVESLLAPFNRGL